MAGGPQAGLYSIHPNHMNVKVPRNITPDDLVTMGPDFERSMAEPTGMSYYLQRVKLGITCREATDALHHFSNPESVDHEVIRNLDAKFENQLYDLPRFLRIDLPSAQLQAEYGKAYDQHTSLQGMAVHFLLNTRRCKLHLPYLIRAKLIPEFAFSRRLALQSARAIFNVRHAILSDSESASAAHLNLGGMLQHIFFATVVAVT